MRVKMGIVKKLTPAMMTVLRMLNNAILFSDKDPLSISLHRIADTLSTCTLGVKSA